MAEPSGERQPADFPEAFAQFMRKGWRDRPVTVMPRLELANYAKRRLWLSVGFPGETVVVPSGNEKVRANDIDFPFRPGSDFVYLTGDHDPDSVLVLRPAGSGHDAVLYSHQRDSTDIHGLWVGRPRSLAEKSIELGIETVPLEQLGKALAGAAPGRTRVLRGLDSDVDRAVPAGGHSRDRALAWFISELKLVKDDWEIAQLQAAIDATVRGFEDVARILPADRPVKERLLEGVFGLRARHDGNGVGYSSIVGAAGHATTPRWVQNTGTTRAGELLLLDMGVEGDNFYTADVTRTIPVSGRFTPVQRRIYDLVYEAQQAGMELIEPGVRFADVHRACTRVIAEGLRDLGLLAISVDEAMNEKSTIYRRWTLHGFGHMLGIDVHDCSNARAENYRDGALSQGYVLTVEPGLYFSPDDEMVPPELRGIGIRIEDDVLVTADGCRNLSAGLPRTSDQVEAWLEEQRSADPRLPS
jgi:Xaa-Pro aminopeptidase